MISISRSSLRKPAEPPAPRGGDGIRQIIGEAAWQRLPAAVRQRFDASRGSVDYIGRFEVVAASPVGRLIARLARVLGSPVATAVGNDIPAVVRVRALQHGMQWHREYAWPDGTRSVVHSTKSIDRGGNLVERLPARLCMPLAVHERHGILHFISTGYYFDLTQDWLRRWGFDHEWRLPLPRWLSPGTTHVEHIDEPDGWFRFTLRVTHERLGQLFFQTGRFRAEGDRR
jgi:hypothetical protein